MRAVVFAAGLGTRLYPITKDKPKALVEVGSVTMLERTLEKLNTSGIKDVIVNVHAFADKVCLFLDQYAVNHPDMQIRISDERDLLLETGGGLKKMCELLIDDVFVVHNVDVLSSIDLTALQKADLLFSQESPKHLATLAVRKTESDRYFLFNDKGFLCGWENVRTGEQKIARVGESNLQRFGFTGIHLLHPEIFPLMTEEGVFSITDVYLRLACLYDIRMMDVSNAEWYDIGSHQQLEVAEKYALCCKNEERTLE